MGRMSKWPPAPFKRLRRRSTRLPELEARGRILIHDWPKIQSPSRRQQGGHGNSSPVNCTQPAQLKPQTHIQGSFHSWRFAGYPISWAVLGPSWPSLARRWPGLDLRHGDMETFTHHGFAWIRAIATLHTPPTRSRKETPTSLVLPSNTYSADMYAYLRTCVLSCP